ncbi:MAG TPA: hypothetical protein VIX37_15365 [Candidatus Sulfotelmatobacter sp.]
MTKQWNRLLLCVVLAALATVWALAQDADAKPKGEVRNMTGCLTRSSGNEFLITAQDGSTWEIHGNNAVDLASQVNHTVEVKGVVSHDKMHNMKEDAKDMAKDSGVKKSDTEHGHLEVTHVRSVSDSCQK